MPHYGRSIGARPLLFERLMESGGPPAGLEIASPGGGPPRMHGEDELRASIQLELSELLNTRAPLPIGALELRERTTVNYGIPDLSAFPLGEHDAMVRLARHVRDAVITYEPRLLDPTVEIVPGPNSGDGLSVILRGSLAMVSMRLPVSFHLPLGAALADPDAR